MNEFRRLPNLSALRAFEAAARHQNFSHAAEEIHLTHGAISHQVRLLEQELGRDLFIRKGKRLSITSAGQQYANEIRTALELIMQASEKFSGQPQLNRLSITALPSFAARWLSPRLGSFIEQHPGLEVSLQSSSLLTDYLKENIDIGIRFGSGKYPGLVSEHLMDDEYFPVVSPNYQQGNLPKSIAELAHAQLLRCDLEPWAPWFRLAGVAMEEPHSGVLFHDSSMLARAAVDAQGIALGRATIVQNELNNGQLLRLFDIVLPSMASYYLVYPEVSMEKPQVRAFRLWLLEQTGK